MILQWFYNFKIVNDPENTIPAITLPLIINDKAIVYLTNKINEETLFLLIKKENEWIIRCEKKYIYELTTEKKRNGNNIYIACVWFVLNPKVNVYLLADFLTGNPVGDYVARQHT